MKPKLINSLLSLSVLLFYQSRVVIALVEEHNNTQDDATCNIVLAPSSIPNAGLGVYALKDYDLGDPIGHASIAIPWIDNIQIFISDTTTNNNTTSSSLLWNRFLMDSPGIGGYGEATNVSMFVPGLPSLVQHHSYLDNVMISGIIIKTKQQQQQHHHQALQQNRDDDLSFMAGSETAYHNVQLIATKPIQRGEELFLFPPSMRHFEEADSSSSSYHHHPRKEAYQLAEDLVQKLKGYVESLESSSTKSTITTAQWTDLLYRIRMDAMEDSMTAQLLPRSQYELELAFDQGLARSKLLNRSLEWILEHHESIMGGCLDSIRPAAAASGPSSSSSSLRGAYAARSLSKGSVISASPMIPVHQEALYMDGNDDDNNNNTRRRRQLLWNYCLGHRQATTILLCPTTAAAMINHNSKTPNVGLRWKEPNPVLHGSLENFFWSTDDVVVTTTTTTMNDDNDLLLILEYVALRDIVEGEELVMDYGPEWENAYRLQRDKQHESIVKDEQTEKISTIRDDPSSLLLSENLPKDLVTECLLYPHLKADAQLDDWQDFVDGMIHRDGWPLELQKLYPPDDQFATWYPCQVVGAALLDDEDASALFSVLIFSQRLHDKKAIRRFRGFPQERIRLATAPYHSDQHLPWAFRQFISIPDEIFPLRWREDYKPASSWKLGVVEDSYLTVRSKVEEQQRIYEMALRQVDCGLYMGVSNIPNSGYGMYAGVDIPFSRLVVGSTIPEIPVDNYREEDQDESQDGDHWPGTEYVWNSFGLAENPEMSSVLRGLFGSIANSHNGVINMVSPMIQNSPYDPMVDRTKDAGAGAFSPYVENTFLSVYPVKAGEELFVTYGEHWFRNRKEYATVPLLEHFGRADNILASLLSMMTLDGSSLFGADVAFKANQDKFNSSYHGQLKDAVAFCQLDGIKEMTEVIKLSRKNDRVNRMPASIVARMDPKDIPHESYQGITYDDKEFQFVTAATTLDGEMTGELPCRIIGSDSSSGLLDVLVFFAEDEKRQLRRYQSFDAEKVHFRISPDKDGLPSLLNLLRKHFLKELDDEGSTTDSFVRFQTALSNIDSVRDIVNVLNRNGTAMATTKRRSKEWLEENGICLDHIYVNRSSIVGAGNGAFARRPLKTNTVLIGSPMLAVSRDHKLLTMTGSPSAKSLIFNYHFGHKESSLLFFPNSHAIAINHNSRSMPKGGKPANARVQFSTKDKKSRYLVHRPLEDIRREKYSSLVMEVVATRDIAPDEEIFIDYGKDWEAAWKEHVKAWEDPCQNVEPPCYKSSMSIWKMNQDKFNRQYHAWSEDHLTYCTIPNNNQGHTNSQANQNNNNVKTVVLTRGDDPYVGVVRWDHDGFQIDSYRDNSGDEVFPCLVIGVNTTSSTFEVVLFNKASSNDSASKSVLKHRKYFSGSWISFRPRQFKGDSMNPLAFRHEIGIPDDAFPEHWKDL